MCLQLILHSNYSIHISSNGSGRGWILPRKDWGNEKVDRKNHKYLIICNEDKEGMNLNLNKTRVQVGDCDQILIWYKK